MRMLPTFMLNINTLVSAGNTQQIARLRQEDAMLINQAAELLDIKQSEFIRTALVRVAQRVIHEMGHAKDK